MRIYIIPLLMLPFGAAFSQSKIVSDSLPLTIEGPGLKVLNLQNQNTSNDKVLTVDGTGLLKLIPYVAATGGGTSQWTTYTGGINYSGSGTGNVGIGIAAPTQKLHVAGNVNITTGDLMFSDVRYLRAPFGQNTLVGINAGQALISTNSNHIWDTFVGFNAGQSATGWENTVVGGNAGSAASFSGIKNTFVGNNAGAWTTSGEHNVYIGRDTGYGNAAGVRNTFVGPNAGGLTSTGSYNTALGAGTSFSETNGVVNQSTAIGFGAVVGASNSIVLGNADAKIGIGTSAPSHKLEIDAVTAGKSGLKLTRLTAAVGSGKVLSVDPNGEVILVPSGTGARLAAEETNWEKSGTNNLVNTNEGGVVIGNGISQTPAGYKLFVQDGILTEKVKVAINNSKDWADYVFHDGYKLKSLESVEQFIKLNKHLPEVPSAGEMVKEGNDLAKTDAILLKKIEELTLYVIELKKEINELKKQ